jgi:membrane-bound lytic murein transglycosylase D
MRRGFAMPDLTYDLVDAHARRFARSDFFGKRADRIRLYLPLIIEELEARKLPLELAMLPLVESALNPQARSPVGATGTWQFMSPTARRFDLRQSRLVDDRQNLRQATRAALDYLQKLHEQFGDWHLAMASYNWGEGRVQAAVSRAQATGRAADFPGLAPRMPAETRNYVPQIVALARLVADPSRYATQLPAIPDGNPLTEVDLSHDSDLKLLMRFSGLSEREFLALNPAVRPPLVLAAATPRLLLPEDAAERFLQAQARHAGRTASWSVVRLDRTQPVDAIAAAHAASSATVRAVNQIPRGTKPVAGSVLLLPVAPAAGTRTSDDVVASASLKVAADTVQVHIQARPRETAADLARRAGVAVADLLGWNGLGAKSARKRLPAGKWLVLWVIRERAAAFPSRSDTKARPTARR